MVYTLWSHGRLLGESELAYARCMPCHRMGDFYPTVLGAQLMPVITGLSPVVVELARAIRARGRGRVPEPLAAEADEAETSQATLYADCAAAADRLAGLELEVRDAAGAVVETEWVAVRDTEFLLSLARSDPLELEDDLGVDPEGVWDAERETAEREMDDRFFEMLEGDEDDPPIPCHLARYQLAVMLRDERRIP